MSIRDGHVDMLLTNISVAYIQSADKFVADKVFPKVPVQKAGDLYFKFPRGYFFRDEVKPRPLGKPSPEAGYKLETDTYYCIEEGLSTTLDDRERANASPPYDPEKTKVLYLTQQHLIHRDRQWAEKYFKSGVWATEVQGVASNPSGNQFVQWDQANSTPVEDIDLYRDRIAELTGFEPNVIVCGRKVFRVLKNHPTVLERIKYTQRGVVTADLLAELFGVEKFLVPGGVYNTAPEGAQDIFQFIIPSNHLLLVYAAPNPGLDMPSGGYTFVWTGLLGDAAFESAIWRGRDERAHSDWFECRMAYDMKVVAEDLGVFFKDAVS